MKKNYSFYLALIGMPIFAIFFLSFGAGQNAVYVSGSPGDIAALAPGNCTLCHTGTATADSPIITLTAPNSYELNTTYPITVASGSVVVKQGFQLSVEDNSGSGNKIGDLTDDGVNNQVFDLGRGEAITHTEVGNTISNWTFQWTSPSTDVGPVTFYVALNESNNDGGTIGDQIHLKQSSSTLSIDNSVFEDLKIFPNPSMDVVTIKIPSQLENNTSIRVFDFLGKQVLNTNLDTSNNTIDVTQWQSGVYIIQLLHDNKRITKRFVKL